MPHPDLAAVKAPGRVPALTLGFGAGEADGAADRSGSPAVSGVSTAPVAGPPAPCYVLGAQAGKGSAEAADGSAHFPKGMPDGVEVMADGDEVMADGDKVMADSVEVKADIAKVKADGVKVKPDAIKVKADGVEVKANIAVVKADIAKVKIALWVQAPHFQHPAVLRSASPIGLQRAALAAPPQARMNTNLTSHPS